MSLIGTYLSDFFGFSAYAVFFLLCVPILYTSIKHLGARTTPVTQNGLLTTLKIFFWAAISYGTFLLLVVGPLFWLPGTNLLSNVFVSGALMMISAVPICYFLYRVIPNGDAQVTLYPSVYLFMFGYIASILYPISINDAIYYYGLGVETSLAYCSLLIVLYVLTQTSYLRNMVSFANTNRPPTFMQQMYAPLAVGYVCFVVLQILIAGFEVSYPSCC